MKKSIFGVILMLSMLLFGYQPTPLPPLDPNDAPYNYDPNLCPSEPMLALIIMVDSTYTGHLKVTEPDGDPVTITLINDANNITVESSPHYEEKDPNDTLGMAMIYHYEWNWTPTIEDMGLHYINVRVSDQYDAFDERTMIVLVKENQPPVITGCR